MHVLLERGDRRSRAAALGPEPLQMWWRLARWACRDRPTTPMRAVCELVRHVEGIADRER